MFPPFFCTVLHVGTQRALITGNAPPASRKCPLHDT
jgi:hypothetical protein